MPGCVLRADGAKFKVDSFLNRSNFKPCIVYHKGEYRFPTSKRKETTSGMNIIVSNASGNNIKRQIKDAISFIRRNKDELSRLKKYHGVESLYLDFGINIKVGHEDSFIQIIRLPEELIHSAGNIGIEIEFTFYPTEC